MLRRDFVRLVRIHRVPIAEACRRFGVSRDTGYRWLRRFDADPTAPLVDRSRRPRACPGRTPDDLAREVRRVRERFGWGARKIHAFLLRHGHDAPSVRTVHALLVRQGLVDRSEPTAPTAPLRFERAAPNDLWQMDHKCNVEIARRRRNQLTILDDHSRYLLRLAPVNDRAVTTAFTVLWNLMGEVGMPVAILTDNAFSSTFEAPATLSWFDANLICLGIRTIHGRPYHPQTQGKVERFHATLEREFLPRARRGSMHEYLDDAQQWRDLYNTVRPHEGIGDAPPIERWRPSERPRPAMIPEPSYPAGSELRKVSTVGDVRWRMRRILAGRGLVGRTVRVQETDRAVELYFAHVKIRSIDLNDLKGAAML